MFSDYVRNDDLTVYAGDDRPITWPLYAADGLPLDISGFTARAQVRESPDATAILHEWSTTLSSIVLTDTAVSLTVSDSDAWTWHEGVYDLHLIDASGRHEVIAWGRIVVRAGVTR